MVYPCRGCSGDRQHVIRRGTGVVRPPLILSAGALKFQSEPRSPRTSVCSRKALMEKAMCSSSATPSSSAPLRISSRDTPLAKSLSFMRRFTESTSRSKILFDGRTYAQAVKKPASSSQAKSVCANLSHADYSNVPRQSALEHTLFACDELAGVLTACAYVRPSKSILDLGVDLVKRRMKGQLFAKGDRKSVV